MANGPRALGAAVLTALVSCLAACGDGRRGGELHAQLALLEREVDGLRTSVAKMERGEPVLPEQAAVVSIGEAVAKQFIDAQLPFRIEVETYRIELAQAEASFKGTPSVVLTGSIVHRDYPDYVGEVRAIGALDSVEVDASGTLRALIAVDHVDLLKMGGLEKYLAGSTIDELARNVRKQLTGKIPEVQIPVKIEQGIELPSITDGPVRLQGATMPLKVAVADVLATAGTLWIAINVVPGELVRATPAPPAGEAAR